MVVNMWRKFIEIKAVYLRHPNSVENAEISKFFSWNDIIS